MGRFLLTRLGLAAITLFLLSVLVFVGANLLPGNVARRKLGNPPDQASVDQLNHQLGTDKPILSPVLELDLRPPPRRPGTSLSYRLPVSELIGPALLHSLKLAASRVCHGRSARHRRRRDRSAEARPAHRSIITSAASRSQSFPSSLRGSC